jgi:hypothetical protein
MVNFIKLESNINIQSIESSYELLYRQEGPNHLLLPAEVKRNFLGNKVAFTQFINTWVRRNKEGHLYIYEPDSAIEVFIEKLANDEFHSHAALSMSFDKGIYGYTSKNDLTSKVKTITNLILQKKINPINTETINTLGEYFEIHFDHKESSTWNKSDLYKWNELKGAFQVKTGEDLQSFVRILSDKCGIRKEYKNKKGKLEKLAQLIYELFDNTQKWATTDFAGKKHTLPNLRGIYFRFFVNSYPEISNSVQGNFPLERYLKKIKEKLQLQKEEKTQPSLFDSTNHVQEPREIYHFFLELSVLDSGAGLASRFSNIDYHSKDDIEGEFEAFQNCFKKNLTSQVGTEAHRRGLGLFNVLTHLGTDAFLKLRTGHLSVYRDFSIYPFVKNDPNFVFGDMFEQSEKESGIKKHDWADGTLFTIIIPLDLN